MVKPGGPRTHQSNSFTNRINKSNNQNNPDRIVSKTKTNLRDRATIKRLAMYSERPTRTRDGKLISGAFMSKDTSHDTRIRPDRRWFGNTRAIGQDQLNTFREEMESQVNNPYKVLLHASKLPLGLLKDSTKKTQMNLLTTESFQTTFGPKKQRKRPNLKAVTDYENMINKAAEITSGYDETKDKNIKPDEDEIETRRKDIFDKGTSKRIWGELYKVIDSSDVLVQVLDARDPMGTRSRHVEQQLKKTSKHKHLIFILNKCDLVPTWATARWVKILSKEYPTLAFHASITNPFGKGSLIQLLRQFSKLHSDKKQISVGFIGYPNVGKSSIINTLKSKVVCKAAPIPGETKVWQYITLMKRIYLIDCPGVVPATGDSEAELVLKGVVRVENLEDATIFIPEVLNRIKKEYIVKTYNIAEWKDHEDFLTQMAERTGKLLKKRQPNMNACAKLVLYDYQKGKIPYFKAPPHLTPEQEKEDELNKIKLESTDNNDNDNTTTTQPQQYLDEAEVDQDTDKLLKERRKLYGDLVVNQKLNNIPVKSEFTEEDAHGEEYVDPFDEEPDWDDLYQKEEDNNEDDDDEDDEELSGEEEELDDEDILYGEENYDDLADGDLDYDEEEKVDQIKSNGKNVKKSSNIKVKQEPINNKKSVKNVESPVTTKQVAVKKEKVEKVVTPTTTTTNKKAVSKDTKPTIVEKPTVAAVKSNKKVVATEPVVEEPPKKVAAKKSTKAAATVAEPVVEEPPKKVVKKSATKVTVAEPVVEEPPKKVVKKSATKVTAAVAEPVVEEPPKKVVKKSAKASAAVAQPVITEPVVEEPPKKVTKKSNKAATVVEPVVEEPPKKQPAAAKKKVTKKDVAQEDDGQDEEPIQEEKPIVKKKSVISKTAPSLTKKLESIQNKVSESTNKTTTETQKPTGKKTRKEYNEMPEVESDSEAGPSKKERRKAINASKVGVHFYETANVKNRNRDRKVPKKPKYQQMAGFNSKVSKSNK
ncbi:hypothetical protein DDB_G0280289 [Dictyostelium discoideum AX4]|uniref:Nucleolar GTP-binding protein 2 n=1 Tax=Dictyostelium discoideum TaxID=44689 RepID=Q54VK1_DICDI|nr:hypothetical protein DDB_G0280289 [Dictyostelium discoideum AX4]EAL67371.1 hypothetical protein DDB_G0280289 [Dictyostelium discoideum AX4]|eukprot:XP_641354.1 hypothetical protein DDB_G0280289 [Dictyostelium discoideum AX4]